MDSVIAILARSGQWWSIGQFSWRFGDAVDGDAVDADLSRINAAPITRTSAAMVRLAPGPSDRRMLHGRKLQRERSGAGERRKRVVV